MEELEQALESATSERDLWKDKATSLALKMADELSHMRLQLEQTANECQDEMVY